jgi:hypothetical protein
MAFGGMKQSLLIDRMLSAEVRLQAPTECEQVEATLTSEQVKKVFTDHVAGVDTFLFRQQPGQFILQFLMVAYKDGFRAFKGTPLDDHLKSLFRLVVHYGYEEKRGAAQYLTEVAEAFMDCQAVQARVVEKVGLEIRGVTANFYGLVTTLLGEYKTMALKMLAVERIQQRKAYDDATPTHYENRLTEDLGQQLGLNVADVRRAALDVHAQMRFAKLPCDEATSATARCRELFDLQAFSQALVAELNSFNEASPANSLPRLFLDWVSEHMREKHVVFDEETCSSVDMNCTLVIAVLEMLYLGGLVETGDQIYRGTKICNIFNDTSANTPSETVAPGQVFNASVVLPEIESLCVPIRDPEICNMFNDTSANTSSEKVAPGQVCNASVVLAEIESMCIPIQDPSPRKPARKRPRNRRANNKTKQIKANRD